MDMQASTERAYISREIMASDGNPAVTHDSWIGFSLATPMTITMDCVAIATGAAAALFLWRAVAGASDRHLVSQMISFCVLYWIGFVLFGSGENLYKNRHSLLRVLESSEVLRVSVFSFVLASLAMSFVARGFAIVLVCAWLGATMFILLLRQTMCPLISRYSSPDVKRRRALIVGSGPEARRIFSYLIHSHEQQLQPVGFLDEHGSYPHQVIYSHGYHFKEHAPVHCGVLDEELLRRGNVSDIFLADPLMSAARRAEISSIAAAAAVDISEVGLVPVSKQRGPSFVQHMDGLVVRSFFRGKAGRVSAYEVLKRFVDLVLALVIVVASLPVWLAIAIWIKSTSDGPVFFKQERIGRYGKPFPMFKFRSMYTTAPKYGRSPEDSRDPRITPAGRFLRKTSLDELPQLLNVLRGEMTLVGPRPEMPYVVDQYTPYQAQRLSVRPGITGFWQLSADRKYMIHESLEYDLYYIENRSFFVDLAVLLHTLVFAMKGV